MAQARPPFHITIPIYAGVDLLDVAAPVELFSWMAQAWQERTTTISLAAEDLSPLKTRDGLILTPQRRFADYAAPEWQTHLLWVPGGDPATLRRLMQGGPYLDFLKAQSAGADHVSSVCEGALLLAAAGPCSMAIGRPRIGHSFPASANSPRSRWQKAFRATSSVATGLPAAAFRRGWTRRWRWWSASRGGRSPSRSR